MKFRNMLFFERFPAPKSAQMDQAELLQLSQPAAGSAKLFDMIGSRTTVYPIIRLSRKQLAVFQLLVLCASLNPIVPLIS